MFCQHPAARLRPRCRAPRAVPVTKRGALHGERSDVGPPETTRVAMRGTTDPPRGTAVSDANETVSLACQRELRPVLAAVSAAKDG